MTGKYSVPLKKLVQEHKMKALHLSTDYEAVLISNSDVNRPAMQLTGFYNYFDPDRIQLLGMVESTYLETLTSLERLAVFDKFMQYDIAALVICHGCTVFPECLEMAKNHNRNLFCTDVDTSTFQASLIYSLHKYLAPRITTHGVLVEVYGEGMLITGDSGIGKSETALELVKRGHRLIADDAVEIKNTARDVLIGTAPELIRYYMELRGIGVINVKEIYGVGSVKSDTEIDMIVHLELWDEKKIYDRLGLTNDSETILGVTRPKLTVPVRPGRNLAVIMELAAMNNRQKKMGLNAAETLAASIDAAVDSGREF